MPDHPPTQPPMSDLEAATVRFIDEARRTRTLAQHDVKYGFQHVDITLIRSLEVNDALLAEVRRLQAQVSVHSYDSVSAQLVACRAELTAVRAAVEEESKRADALKEKVDELECTLGDEEAAHQGTLRERFALIESEDNQRKRADRAEQAARELREAASEARHYIGIDVTSTRLKERINALLDSTAWLTGGNDGSVR